MDGSVEVVLAAIGKLDISSAERKFLRRRAVESAARPLVGYDAISLFEEVTRFVAQRCGRPVGLGEIRWLLQRSGHGGLAKVWSSVVVARRLQAHPPISLCSDIEAVLADLDVGRLDGRGGCPLPPVDSSCGVEEFDIGSDSGLEVSPVVSSSSSSSSLSLPVNFDQVIEDFLGVYGGSQEVFGASPFADASSDAVPVGMCQLGGPSPSHGDSGLLSAPPAHGSCSPVECLAQVSSADAAAGSCHALVPPLFFTFGCEADVGEYPEGTAAGASSFDSCYVCNCASGAPGVVLGLAVPGDLLPQGAFGGPSPPSGCDLRLHDDGGCFFVGHRQLCYNVVVNVSGLRASFCRSEAYVGTGVSSAGDVVAGGGCLLVDDVSLEGSPVDGQVEKVSMVWALPDVVVDCADDPLDVMVLGIDPGDSAVMQFAETRVVLHAGSILPVRGRWADLQEDELVSDDALPYESLSEVGGSVVVGGGPSWSSAASVSGGAAKAPKLGKAARRRRRLLLDGGAADLDVLVDLADLNGSPASPAVLSREAALGGLYDVVYDRLEQSGLGNTLRPMSRRRLWLGQLAADEVKRAGHYLSLSEAEEADLSSKVARDLARMLCYPKSLWW
jgi:hypothetical protein